MEELVRREVAWNWESWKNSEKVEGNEMVGSKERRRSAKGRRVRSDAREEEETAMKEKKIWEMVMMGPKRVTRGSVGMEEEVTVRELMLNEPIGRREEEARVAN